MEYRFHGSKATILSLPINMGFFIIKQISDFPPTTTSQNNQDSIFNNEFLKRQETHKLLTKGTEPSHPRTNFYPPGIEVNEER